MQELPALAGARGWAWRVDPSPAAPVVWRLARTGARGVRVLAALRPYEPIARLPRGHALRPVDPARAGAAIAEAAQQAQPAFGVPAAARLRGEMLPWQLAPALALARGHARVLVSDAAGAGKTVSAAIAIAATLDARDGARVLVAAPGHLIGQWADELASRMAISARVCDAAALSGAARDLPAGITAWDPPGCALASLDFLKQPHVLRDVLTAPWDLLVIDEAHTVAGTSERHQAMVSLARRAYRVLLLTATPSDGGTARLRALLTIGALRASDAVVVLRHERNTPPVRLRRLRVRAAWSTRLLHAALARYATWIAEAPAGADRAADGRALLCSLLIKRAVSSPRSLALSLERRLRLLGPSSGPFQPHLAFDAEDDGDDRQGVLGIPSGRPMADEAAALRRMLRVALRAARGDRRLRALDRLLRSTREPVIVFTCFADTARELAGRIAAGGERAALVTGDLPIAAFEEALHAFLTGAARVLVATDVASQGLNLQARTRWVVHVDLPWRPPGIRQRNGRVDRIGQTQRPHATALIDRTPLARGLLARVEALSRRMARDERPSARRWRVLAEAESQRLCEWRAAAPGPCAPLPLAEARVRDATVVETDLLDAEGRLVERRVDAWLAPPDAALRQARRAAGRRARRLRRALRAREARMRARRDAVSAGFRRAAKGTLVQPGLFERRSLRGVADQDRRWRASVDRDDDRVTGPVARVSVRVTAAFSWRQP